MDKIYFVLPAYNEAENIDDVVKQWYAVVQKINDEGNEATLCIADDGSKDDTWNSPHRAPTSNLLPKRTLDTVPPCFTSIDMP